LKRPAWVIVLWLISLQILSPFVHAHLEKDGIDHASVMHLHTAVSDAHRDHNTNPVLENPHGPHQILSIAQGILKNIDASQWLVLLPAIFVAIFCKFLASSTLGFKSQLRLQTYYRYRHPQTQAPPPSF